MLNRPGDQPGLPPLDMLFAGVAGEKHIGLAVSGGADSLALMLLAGRWAADRSITATVYTVDHRLRAEAAKEAAFVAVEADRLGLRVRVLRWEGEKPESGLQAAARRARYELIGAAMREDGATVLLTAHHLRDQAETVLMRLAHGSGLTGLGGMSSYSHVFGVPVYRPLLETPPEILTDVVARAGLRAIEDPSNTDTDFERVRWRQALPMLTELGLDMERLAQFARRAKRTDTALQGITRELFSRLATLDGLGVVRLARREFGGLDAELRIRLLRMALDMTGDGQKPFALQQIEDLADRLVQPGPFTRTTLAGAVIDCDAEAVIVYREAGRMEGAELTVPPGETVSWDGRFSIENRRDESIVVVGGGLLTREVAEQLLPQTRFQMAQLGAVPLVRAMNGAVLALGTFVFDDKTGVSFTRD